MNFDFKIGVYFDHIRWLCDYCMNHPNCLSVVLDSNRRNNFSVMKEETFIYAKRYNFNVSKAHNILIFPNDSKIVLTSPDESDEDIINILSQNSIDALICQKDMTINEISDFYDSLMYYQDIPSGDLLSVLGI